MLGVFVNEYLEFIKVAAPTVTILVTAFVTYVLLKIKNSSLELRTDIENSFYMKLDVLQKTFHDVLAQHESKLKESGDVVHEIEKYVHAEIRVIKQQIADRDVRLDKVEQKIDSLTNIVQEIKLMLIKIHGNQND